ncbi:putative cysteine desulfurase, mitochondrial [Smittium culicis]|uniref:Cysteine desulfurase, mitosomal n=1 Tax=Smittium culicis TaxID=133412 RepID=A0A1R1YHJ5_9FUNG|nr:putative cysteine desulfurase, mitochondrial [Smittium culicis]
MIQVSKKLRIPIRKLSNLCLNSRASLASASNLKSNVYKRHHATSSDAKQGQQINLREWKDPSSASKDALTPIYLDSQATTMLDPRVLDKMMPYLTNEFGNPHSKTHQYGWDADLAVEQARENVANLIGAQAKEIVFTSGATESNNLAIKGIANFYGSSATPTNKKHIITSQIEHKCVLDSCRYLEDSGRFEVTYLPVDKDGLVDPQAVAAAIKPETILVSLMYVNNEIGCVQKIKEIGDICKKHKGVFFHTDAAQAVGKVGIDVNSLGVDLMSISGHKLYGPKGVGALYTRRRPRVRLDPIISGGGQERGLRSGTLAPALVVGLGSAAEVAQHEMEYDSMRIGELSDYFVGRIMTEIKHVNKNGNNKDYSYKGCVNLSFQFIEGESLLLALKGVALSSGSACTSASLEPSYVLRSLGVTEDSAHSSIRFGIGRFTTKEEIDYTVDLLKVQVERLRELSPLYEMFMDGIDINSIQWSSH